MRGKGKWGTAIGGSTRARFIEYDDFFCEGGWREIAYWKALNIFFFFFKDIQGRPIKVLFRRRCLLAKKEGEKKKRKKKRKTFIL